MPIDQFDGYDRFIYKEISGGDLAPPHGVWDAHKQEWAAGCYSTRAEAQACANGMNAFREITRRTDRTLTLIRSNLLQALRSVEAVS